MSSALPQAVDARLTRAAIFLVLTMNEGAKAEDAVRALSADLSALVRGIGFRAQESSLSCVVGVGSNAWDRLFGAPRPKELHPFRDIQGVHHAPATPGDLLFHIRAERLDLCFELATQISQRLADVVEMTDEVHGFKYFDARDLLGFVDGTENPVAEAARQATLIGDEDVDHAGGSYVIVQKYLHDLAAWNAIPVEQQERIIGRQKLSDIELPASAKPSYAHNVLTNISENGQPLQILRDNMPFGTVSKGEFGTYFIGYARSPRRIEQMLNHMFIGNPPGNYDRVLDVSRAVTGGLFFVPTADFLDNAVPVAIAVESDRHSTAEVGTKMPVSGSSLHIGSLKDEGKS